MLESTGERFVPSLRGQIYYEHVHRYAIAARFSTGKRVLDIACGEGYGSALLAREAAQVVGVDLDDRAIDHARRTYYAANLRFLKGSCTEIPLADGSMDVIASFETIEHIAEHERMLDELRRVLAPGGVLVISSPNKLVYSDISKYSNPYHEKELYFAELRDLLARRYRHVGFYGQRLTASSVVHPLAGSTSAEPTWYNGSVAAVVSGLPTLSDPMYFVAVCSDEPLAFDISSAFLDPGDDLLSDIYDELNELRSRQQLPSAGAAAIAGGTEHAALEQRTLSLATELADAAQTRTDLEVRASDLSSALEEAAQTRARLESDLARRDGDVAQLEAEIARLGAEHVVETMRLRDESQAEIARQLAGAEDSATSLRGEIASLTEALQNASRDSVALREVLNSRSWKLTSPLRRAFGAMHR